MNLLKRNLITDPASDKTGGESFEQIISGENITIERIVTNESFETPGIWYDQDKDELVVLLQGKAVLEFENHEIITLNEGDSLIIAAHKVHRVLKVSTTPNCIWLAIHGNFK